MRVRSSLHGNLTAESKAYGYTLCIWGSGTVLLAAMGIPTVWDVLALAFGSVLGFGILALLTYGAFFREVEVTYSPSDRLIAVSILHFIASLGTIGVSAIIAQVVPYRFWAFLLVGVNASVSYNIGLLIEVVVYKRVHQLERRILDR